MTRPLHRSAVCTPEDQLQQEAETATAYTAGRDIVFGTGQYSTDTTERRRILAQEMVQQRRDGPGTLELFHPVLSRQAVPRKCVACGAGPSLLGDKLDGPSGHSLDVPWTAQIGLGSLAKATDVTPEDDTEEKPSPAKDATIQCDGTGGYEIVYGDYEGATCGTKNCVTVHENSHIADWKAKWVDGCKGQAQGYLPKGDPPDVPLLTAAEYNAFLKDSECRAHTKDLECATKLPKTKECAETIDNYIKLTKDQKANWC
jgi:hypothetical protein